MPPHKYILSILQLQYSSLFEEAEEKKSKEKMYTHVRRGRGGVGGGGTKVKRNRKGDIHVSIIIIHCTTYIM